jgi:tRNA(Ile)-lysidine synthase
LISLEQFSESIDALLPGPQTIAVAVSGGADSLCLCMLLDAWSHHHNTRVIALTVDHQLRPESPHEAEQVHRWLSQRGIEHYVLKWEKPSYPSNLQDSARQARYELLSQWCQIHGVPVLAVAHNQEDQVETVLLRLAHHSGPTGLAAIPDVRVSNNLRIIRPLLNFSKKHIIETLRHFKQEWIEDPSNQNTKFTRVQIRKKIESLHQAGLTVPRILKFQQQMSKHRMHLERMAQDFCHQHVNVYPSGYCDVDLAALRQTLPAVTEMIMINLLNLISGNRYPPRQASLTRTISKLLSNTTTTCQGCLLHPIDDKLLICREEKNISASAYFKSSKTINWDNRFTVSIVCEIIPEDLRVEALGNKWLDFTQNPSMMSLPSHVRPNLPSLWQKERLLYIPFLDYDGNLEVISECKFLFYPTLSFCRSRFIFG